MDKMQDLLLDNPIILGVKSDDDIPIVLKNDNQIVFILYGEISNISDIVDKYKAIGKTVFVNIDLVDGFSVKNSVITFMKKNTKAEGVISSKAAILRYAKEMGFYTIHRFFVIDSMSYRNIKKQIDISQTDMINIVPGWTKVIEWTSKAYQQPVIASGLVCDKKTVIESLQAGAIAISTTNHEVWEM